MTDDGFRVRPARYTLLGPEAALYDDELVVGDDGKVLRLLWVATTCTTPLRSVHRGSTGQVISCKPLEPLPIVSAMEGTDYENKRLSEISACRVTQLDHDQPLSLISCRLLLDPWLGGQSLPPFALEGRLQCESRSLPSTFRLLDLVDMATVSWGSLADMSTKHGIT